MGRADGMNVKREKYVVALLSKHEGKTHLRRSSLRWVNNITVELKQVGLEGVHWINLAQDREKGLAVVNTVMNIRVR
jgi:hypothetical protein